jgi:hypothetical protein
MERGEGKRGQSLGLISMRKAAPGGNRSSDERDGTKRIGSLDALRERAQRHP